MEATGLAWLSTGVPQDTRCFIDGDVTGATAHDAHP